MQVIAKYDEEVKTLKVFKGSSIITRIIKRTRPLRLSLYGHLGDLGFLKDVSGSVVRIHEINNRDKLLKGIKHATNLESLSVTFKNKDSFEFDCLQKLNHLEVFRTSSHAQLKSILSHISLKHLLIREFRDDVWVENNVLESLYISGSFSDFSSFSGFNSLREIRCVRGTTLQSIDGLPRSVRRIELEQCNEVSNFSHLKHLTNLETLGVISSGSTFPTEIYDIASLCYLILPNGSYFGIDWNRLFSLPKILKIGISSADIPNDIKLHEMAKKNKRELEEIARVGTKKSPGVYITFRPLD